MAESIIFRGTHVRYFDGRQEEGGAFVRVHLTSEFSSVVMDEMDWSDPGPSVTDAKLEGELHATHLILTPGDKQLANHEIQFDIRSIEDFKVVTVTEKESKRRELRFVARSSAEGVAALVDNYIRRIGEHQGALKVSYVKQEELDLQAEKAEAKAKKPSTGCKVCDAGIPLKPNDDSEHVNGVACKLWTDPPAPPAENPAAAEPIQEGAGMTAAEKKKARLEEERLKREAKGEAKGEWPVPNQHGAYEASPELTLEFLGKKCSASIEYLQLGPNRWISAASTQTPNGGYGSPLAASEVYPSKEIAIALAAYDAAERAEKSASIAGPAAKPWQSVHEWFVEQYGLYSGRVEAPDGWMEVDYRVIEEPEPVEAAS